MIPGNLTGRRFAALVVLGGAVACAAPPAAAGAAQPETCAVAMERHYVIGDPPGAYPLGARSFRAVCRLPADARARLLDAAGPGAAVLWVEGIRADADETVSVRVSLSTSGRAPAYAGSFTLLPDEGGGRPGRVQVPVGRAVAEALHADDVLSVTLEAVDPDGRSVASTLTFDRLVLQLR